MEITNEIIAKYIDGTATPEEVSCVRQYLVQHPEENENILTLMDDHEDYWDEWDDAGYENCKDSVFSDIMMSAAAFAPTLRTVKRKKRSGAANGETLLSRMSNMLDELDHID